MTKIEYCIFVLERILERLIDGKPKTNVGLCAIIANIIEKDRENQNTYYIRTDDKTNYMKLLQYKIIYAAERLGVYDKDTAFFIYPHSGRADMSNINWYKYRILVLENAIKHLKMEIENEK